MGGREGERERGREAGEAEEGGREGESRCVRCWVGGEAAVQTRTREGKREVGGEGVVALSWLRHSEEESRDAAIRHVMLPRPRLAALECVFNEATQTCVNESKA